MSLQLALKRAQVTPSNLKSRLLLLEPPSVLPDLIQSTAAAEELAKPAIGCTSARRSCPDSVDIHGLSRPWAQRALQEALRVLHRAAVEVKPFFMFTVHPKASCYGCTLSDSVQHALQAGMIPACNACF